MKIEEAMITLESILNPYCLSDVQEMVCRQSLEGATYSEMALDFGYNTDYIKEVGAQLWKLLSIKLQMKVTKKNLWAAIRKTSLVTSCGGDSGQSKPYSISIRDKCTL